MSVLQDLFINEHNRVVGVLGNTNTAKSSLVLSSLIDLKEACPTTPIYVFGVESSLRVYLKTKGIKYLHSTEDILDLKLKNSVIYIDEVNQFFSTRTRDKQTDRLKRFVNRLFHQNCWVIMSTAEVGYFNKLACSLINCFLVKQVELDSLVNNTWVKRLVKGLPRSSEYRVELHKSQYYVLDVNALTKKCSFKYNCELDSKIDNINPFKKVNKKEKKKLTKKVIASEDKRNKKRETKGDDLK